MALVVLIGLFGVNHGLASSPPGGNPVTSLVTLDTEPIAIARYEYYTVTTRIGYEAGGACIYVDDVIGTLRRSVFQNDVYRRRVDIPGSSWTYYRTYYTYGDWFCTYP
jgi:hypothetical protein